MNSRRESLFENFAEGILDEAEYQFAKKKYDEDTVMLDQKLTDARAKKQQLSAVLASDCEWMKKDGKTERVKVCHTRRL